MHRLLAAVASGFTLVALLTMTRHSFAGGPRDNCTPSAGPDVIVGDLIGWNKYGTVGGISGYTFGTTSCNIGNQVLSWIANGNQHPVIAMNAYRLMNGRLEQIGMSWVKHGWGASAENVCCSCINPQNFEALGVGCSDPYDAGTNGIQGGFVSNGHLVAGLGPRSEVNAWNGSFPWPFTTQGMNGNAIYKRLQIAVNDLDPAQNPGALYFAESEYVTPNEAAVGNHFNNESYRQFFVNTFTSGAWTLSFSTPTIQRQSPAIQAWKDNDSTVMIQNGQVPGEGRFILGTRVSSNGNGTWHYEYAVFNMNSDRSGGGFSVPVPHLVNVTSIEFHDVNYHSGEPYDGSDWTIIPLQGVLKWATTDFGTNANANALRWGTLYNFRFDADTPPRSANATLGLFKPGSPTSIDIASKAPSRRGDTNGDNAVNIDDLVSIITTWGRCPTPPAACPSDLDGNGQVNIDDLVLAITNWG